MATTAAGYPMGASGIALILAGAGLAERNQMRLDQERRAARVSNLLVVLCSDKDMQPIVNTGTLYH